MNVAYFDCFSGISGDMVLGALVDAGLDPDALKAAIGQLGLDGITLNFKKDRRGYLAGTKADVSAEKHSKDRHLPEIRKIIDKAALPDRVKERAHAIFVRLAEAEAAVHGITPEKVHFHEVGALDAIADIVGAAAGLELLGIDRVYCSPLALGEGQVKCRHGQLPVPAPAVVRLTRGFEVRMTGIGRELTTPTGAAIVTTLAGSSEKPSSFVMKEVGYGFGREAEGSLPNALRVVLGAMPDEAREQIVLLETNIDDITGETAGHLISRCLDEGALDAYALPIQMKKSRPGLLFCALCRIDHLERIRTLIHIETGTLGIRIQPVLRSVLPREAIVVETSLGPVQAKKILLPDGKTMITPEYDDAARIAREKNLPLRQVFKILQTEA